MYDPTKKSNDLFLSMFFFHSFPGEFFGWLSFRDTQRVIFHTFIITSWSLGAFKLTLNHPFFASHLEHCTQPLSSSKYTPWVGFNLLGKTKGKALTVSSKRTNLRDVVVKSLKVIGSVPKMPENNSGSGN